MLTREKCREIAAAAMSRMGPLSVYAADALFAAFEAERSTWIASIDVGDERREFEARVHAMACAMVATGAAWSPVDLVDSVRAVDAALAKERA